MQEKEKRIYYFDNLKYLLIVLVVFGHLINPAAGKYYLVKCIYDFIYFFHMPLFFFVAGYFSKNHTDSTYIKKNIDGFLLPYLVLQVVYYVFDFFVIRPKSLYFSVFFPNGELWFLLSLLSMKIFLPYAVRIKNYLLLFFGFSLAAGCFADAGEFMSLLRTIIFFPYFLIGYYIRDDRIKNIYNRFSNTSAVLILACVFVAYYASTINFPPGLLSARLSYPALGFTNNTGILYRIATTIITIILSICILKLVPKAKTFFSVYGEKTLFVFLLHPFIVRLFHKYLYNYVQGLHEWYILILLFLISVLIVYVLSNTRVVKMFNFLVKPPLRITK